jgi:hypothetical protein
MAEREGFIGGPTGGIPERVFQRPFLQSEEVTGLSGNILLGTVSSSEVRLHADYYNFVAHRFTRDEQTLCIRAKTRSGIYRHPDLYAAKLVARSLNFFDQEGPTITTIRGAWGAGSDNYQMYRELNPQSQEQELAAAGSVWEGGLAQRLGFDVQSVQDHGETIIALFSRPQQG